jgi:DNA-directed RNA polymerase subunit RPC12/RpoP
VFQDVLAAKQNWSGNDLVSFKEYFKPYRFGLPNTRNGRAISYIVVGGLLLFSEFKSVTISLPYGDQRAVTIPMSDYHVIIIMWAMISLVAIGINRLKKDDNPKLKSYPCPDCKTPMTDPDSMRCPNCGGTFIFGKKRDEL